MIDKRFWVVEHSKLSVILRDEFEFYAYVKPFEKGVKTMQTILLVLDSKKLENPDLDIRYELPSKVEQYTDNEITDNGYDYLNDTELGIWMKTQFAKDNFGKVVKFLEQHMVCGNDLSGTAKVYISEKDAASLEECTLVYDGEEKIPNKVVRANNRMKKIGKIILRIAGIITDENMEVTGQLESRVDTLSNIEEQWKLIVEVLKKSKYVYECNEDIELSEFLKLLKETVTVKANELPIKKNMFDEDGDWYEWCEVLDEQWEDKGYCMAIYETEDENEIVFPCSIKKIEELSELAKEICGSIVAVAEY